MEYYEIQSEIQETAEQEEKTFDSMINGIYLNIQTLKINHLAKPNIWSWF